MRHQLASIYGYIVTGPYSAASIARLSSRTFTPASPSDSTSDCPTAILLAKNYFNLLSYSPSRALLLRSTVPPSLPPSPGPRRRARTRPRPGMDLLALFRDLFSPRAPRDLWRRVY